MPKEPPGFRRRARWLPPPFIKRHNEVPTMDRPKPLPGYLGGNCEFGTGVARLAVGAWAVNPIAAQLMSIPAAPYRAAVPVAGVKPVIKFGRVAGQLMAAA